MGYSIQHRLLRRELDSYRSSKIPSLYGHKTWVNNLDIVNELGGHHGCVNALSWSTSGRLLASGSDDTNLVIHSYEPDGKSKPFALTTSISTGHTANIFSIKFMPHSNDNTLVSCAGDSQVRVFDIEYSSRSHTQSSNGLLGTSGGATYGGTRYLSEGDTNAKVFKSHSDRVKRIVTESSPHLFLTCSEDGEVRQWDLRQPASAYPEPRGGVGSLSGRRDADDRVPPPLISYRRFRLDLNTISCSASQPHYIALGGAHLHCFLHDRRMIGRDMSAERGSPASDFSIDTDFHGDLMGQATQCVRRFAPNGQKKMNRSSNGHITACKISDANPNELIASWSGDHIYSFDILRSPDAREAQSKISALEQSNGATSQESQDRKRKRSQAASPGGSATKHQRSRSATGEDRVQEDMTLRVRYENGQSEEIALQTDVSGSQVESARQAMLTPSQKRSLRIARTLVKIRKLIFSVDPINDLETSRAPTLEDYNETFTTALHLSSKCLSDMDDVIKSWRYPVDPLDEEVALHKTMRKQRDRARRFIQAAGTLSYLLCGTGPSERLEHLELLDKFNEIRASATEGPFDDNAEIFRYDFLKAVLAWLQGGSQRLIQVFRKEPASNRKSFRFPIPANGGAGSVNRYLMRHLLLIAGQNPISDLETSRFARDDLRQVFPSERDAVTAFSHAVELSNSLDKEVATSAEKESMDLDRAHDSSTAKKFWGLKVARGLLMNAAEGVDFATVDRAFGGLGIPRRVDAGRNQTDINPEVQDPEVESAEIVRSREHGEGNSQDPSNRLGSPSLSDQTGLDEVERLLMSEIRDGIFNQVATEPSDYDPEDEDEGNSEDDDMADADSNGEDHTNADSVLLESDSEDDGGDSQDEDDEGNLFTRNRMLFHSASERAQLRESVDAHVPVSGHTRSYEGHCNVQTVKDVNFYGLQDEYVVSGSDSGHIFIWDRKTAKLLNVLEGDGDVVNVIQGHPYEPMMAVSGIDATVKIFSADRRSQRDARLGFNIAATQNQSDSGLSSLGGRRLRRRRADTEEGEPLLGDSGDAESRRNRRNAEDEEDERERAAALVKESRGISSDSDDAVADMCARQRENEPRRRGLTSRRRMHEMSDITSRNDLERQGGMRDAYITRGMLQLLALHLRAHRGGAGDADTNE